MSDELITFQPRIDDPSKLDQTIRALLDQGGTIVSVTPQRETLESYFTRQIKTLKEVTA